LTITGLRDEAMESLAFGLELSSWSPNRLILDISFSWDCPSTSNDVIALEKEFNLIINKLNKRAQRALERSPETEGF